MARALASPSPLKLAPPANAAVTHRSYPIGQQLAKLCPGTIKKAPPPRMERT
ncbi:hypothetical protein [Neoroseomonas terrae]|uniref:hypothetical protein n=1 Tax=Neoroseomonas terrae TaxID=424799 RepID=UPI001BABE6A0|nr:hypothetical protein [Neoroseomonas terrae]